MKILSHEFKMPGLVPIVAILILIIIILSIWYSATPDNKKLAPILSGLISGSIVLFVQLLLSWKEQSKLKKYDELKIKNILATRDDPEYYRPLIKSAKKEIRILGVTCSRFLQDFVDDEPSAPEKNKVLFIALDRKKIIVKILIADENTLTDPDDKDKCRLAKLRLQRLIKLYPDQFFYAYYQHIPTHSVMVIDDESIVGPIFTGVSSKYSPAIHLENSSKLIEHYRNYFDKVWEECSKNQPIS